MDESTKIGGTPADAEPDKPPDPDPLPGPVRGRRRGRAWVRVAHGLYRPADTDDELRASLDAWQLLLPDDACFTHLTSAQLRGWWLPPLPDDLPVFVAMPKSGTAPERAGLRVIRTTQPPAWEWIDGLRVATPAETLLACARDLGTLDLLVLIDSSLCEREGQRGTVTFAELGSAASRRAWGAPRLREASKIADSRADSAWETLLRALHWACEIDVEPQFELFTDDGRFVARGDLWLKGTTRFHEYDGGDHLARKQQRKDRKRDGRIDDESWSRRGYTAEDVLSQATRILRDADEALGREHDPTRIRAWNALLRQSLFTPAGMARFCRRLGLAPADEDAA